MAVRISSVAVSFGYFALCRAVRRGGFAPEGSTTALVASACSSLSLARAWSSFFWAGVFVTCGGCDCEEAEASPGIPSIKRDGAVDQLEGSIKRISAMVLCRSKMEGRMSRMSA